MVVKLKWDETKKDIEVLIEYPEMSKTVTRIRDAVKAAVAVVKCKDDANQTILLGVTDIYYAESVEKRVFLYDKDKVYRCEMPLYRLAELLGAYGFTQVSKSCVLNLKTLVRVKPIFNARMEATLTNGEKLYISRKYIPMLKQKLEDL